MQNNTKESRDIAAILKDVELVGKTLRAAIREDILRHKAEGLPIAVWEDGQVKWIAPEDIEAEPAEG